jgi:hypothetical protein
VNGHPFTAYPGIDLEAQLDLLVKLGARQYRIDLRSDGSAENLERLLTLSEARGISVLPVIGPDVSFETDSAELIYYKSHAIGEALARRFAGRIKVWELGNEFETYAIILPCEMRDDGTQYPCVWGPASGGSVLDYFGPRWKKVSAALHGMSDGVHAGDPNALRAMGVAGWGRTGAFERFVQDGIAWDVSVWHMYAFDQIAQLERVASYGKPIWITEFNNPNGSQQGERAQADGLAALIAQYRSVRTRLRVESAAIYELLDEPYWQGFEAEMGLVHMKKDAAGRWSIGDVKTAFTTVQSAIAAGAP